MSLQLPRNLRKVAGLWEVQSGRGNTYLRGGSKTHKLYAFRNVAAEPGEPEWLLYAEEKPATAQPAATQATGPHPPPRSPQAPRTPFDKPPRRAPAQRRAIGSSSSSVPQPVPVPFHDDPLAELFTAPPK